jgi:AraC-like DNA-binding protein
MGDLIRKYASAQSSHTHDGFHQIIVPISGNLELELDGTQGIVGHRQIGIVSQGETHAFRAASDNRFLVLDIKDDTLDHVWERAVDQPFHTMSEALFSLSDYAVFCSQKQMDQDWLETWQKLFLQTLSCDLKNDLPALPQRLAKAISYMEQNLAQSISNKDLAEASCLSPARFHEVFRQSTGISPQQYLTQCRLEAAKKKIILGDSIAQAADSVGFADQSSFGKAFRKAYGLSPGQWRKQELETKKQ